MTAAKRLGVVTIGQSPRDDVLPFLAPVWGEDVELVQAGALDGLSPCEIADLAPWPGDYVLVSRLRDGSSVPLRREAVVPLVQRLLDRFAQEGLPVVLLLCTGQFPPFRYPGLLLEPELLLRHAVAGLCAGARLQRLGVLTPLPEQLSLAREKWRLPGVAVSVAAASPYSGEEARLAAAAELRRAGAELVVLDCIGYTPAMKAAVARAAGVPAVAASTLLARLVAEIL